MVKLIPDTNFLIYLAKYKLLDKIENYELWLLKPVLQELISISKGDRENAEDRNAASLTLQFLDKIQAKTKYIENVEGKADDAILELAVRENCLVGTMDKELIERLKKEKIKILIVRQKKLLEEK